MIFIRSPETIKKETLYIIYAAIISKILIFIKDILTASKIGTSYKMDTYLLALSTIMLLTNIIADGILVSLIPLLQNIEEKHGKDRRLDYTNNLINLVFLGSTILIIIGTIGAPYIIRFFGPGFKSLELDETILLYRIGLPIILVSWIKAIGGGVLQADHAFRAGAKGSISSQLVFIIYLLFFAKYFGLAGLMISGTVAVISQIYFLLKAMKKKGFIYKWRLNLKDEYLLKLLKYLIPIATGVGVNQINNSVDNAIASTLAPGSIAELNYANDIISLFLGIFIASIVTVIFPVLSESHKKGDLNNLRQGINHGAFQLSKIAIPVSIILMLMAEPIVKVVFQRGAFDATASFFTAQALTYYAIGLPAMAMIPLITRAYYSIDDMKTPLVISISALIINIIVDLTLAPIMGARGLALGTSFSVIIASIIGLINLNKRIGFTRVRETSETLVKLSVAATIMIGGILLTYGTSATSLSSTFFHNLVTVGVSSLVGVGLYYLVYKILDKVT